MKYTISMLYKISQENELLLTEAISLKYKEYEKSKELSQILNSKAYKSWQLLSKLKKYSLMSGKIIFHTPVLVLYIITFTLIFTLSKLINTFRFFLHHKLTLTSRETMLDGVSFIIPTWNKKDMVLKCLSLLDKIVTKERYGLPIEIIIIDNGSIDGTYEALQNFKSTNRLLILKQSINLGFAKAINLAVQTSQYNYVYLLNNDMEPQNGFFKELVNFCQQLISHHKPFFGISSQIFFYDKSKRREESGKTYLRATNGFLEVAHLINNFNLENTSITAFVGGGSSLINRHLFQKLGMFDNKTYTPLYCEDMDAGYQAWKHGYPSYFVPASHVIHHHQSSSKNLSHVPGFYMHKNFLTFILKNSDSLITYLSHLFPFMLKILLLNNYHNYATENLKNSINIFKSKIESNKYLPVFSDSELFDFVKFETKYGSQYL